MASCRLVIMSLAVHPVLVITPCQIFLLTRISCLSASLLVPPGSFQFYSVCLQHLHILMMFLYQDTPNLSISKTMHLTNLPNPLPKPGLIVSLLS